jgi:putative ABC transport system permease protein
VAAPPRRLQDRVLLQGLRIAGIGVDAGVVFGIVFARGVGRYVADVNLPGMLTFIASALVILAAAAIASKNDARKAR